MSDTTETTQTPAEAPASTPAPETTQAAETPPPATTEAPETPSEGEKPQARGDRRFAVLTAKAAAEREAHEREREAYARELAELKARLALQEAGARPDGSHAPAPVAPTPDAVRAAAEQLRQTERFNEARTDLVQRGVKELGAEAWNEKTNMLHAMGATQNQAFMEALVELPGAEKLVSALADDPDKLAALLDKRPAAMAAELGRMSAELTAPRVKPLSSAPAPVQPLNGRGALPEPDVTKMNAQQLVAHWNSKPPAFLGGRRKRA